MLLKPPMVSASMPLMLPLSSRMNTNSVKPFFLVFSSLTNMVTGFLTL